MHIFGRTWNVGPKFFFSLFSCYIGIVLHRTLHDGILTTSIIFI